VFEWVKAQVLRLMRVPHEPDPPLGAPGSVKVFRAGINYYHLRQVRWLFGQAGAIIGIGFSLVFLAALEAGVERARQTAASLPSPTATPTPTPVPAPAPADTSGDSSLEATAPEPALSPPPRRTRTREERRAERERVMANVVARTPYFVMPLIRLLEILGIAFLFFQMMVTYAIVRLEFEQHWYIVTDRSLRIRTGVLRLQESTMSFANIQQVEIRQGPLQRFLGLANVQVRSAGGGGDTAAGAQGHGQEASLHTGVFEGVSNAVEIRDLILERLRKFREAGLGDPEDRRSRQVEAAAATAASGSTSATEAVEVLLNEARALRQAVM